MNLFKLLKNFIQKSRNQIDSMVFRLHCKITVMILLLSSLLVILKQYTTKPIKCMFEDLEDRKIAEIYCLDHLVLIASPTHQSHPGLNTNEEKHFIKYYHWVWACLILQVSFIILLQVHKCKSNIPFR